MRADGVPGIDLERSTLGGYSVNRKGARLGWIHGDDRDGWRAFVPSGDNSPGRPLGKAESKDGAVLLIVAASPPA